MNDEEFYDLEPWFEAGEGKKVKGTPHRLAVRKGFLKDHGNGVYSLTERGAAQAGRKEALYKRYE